jgi:alpha-galactosidase
MWRISDDFWDEWPLLEAQFTRLENWNPHAGRAAGRMPTCCRWAAWRSGARDTASRRTSSAPDDAVVDRALAADHGRRPAVPRRADAGAADQSRSDRGQPAQHRQPPHFIADGLRVWTARAADRPGHYLSLFNLTGKVRRAGVRLDDVGLPAEGRIRDLWARTDRGRTQGRLEVDLPPHGACLYGVAS